MKPFSSHATQIQILKARGLIFKDEKSAQKIFSRKNYYSVINGYKNPFLKRNEQNSPVVPEEYREGTSFEEIHKLFLFDRELRILLLNELLKFENNIKSKIAYRFSEKFQEPNAYLLEQHYSQDKNLMKNRDKLIATMSSLIKNNTKRIKVNHPAIKHYDDKYQNIPLWVLVNFLTIGNISYFYQSIDESLRNKIAKDFAEEFSDEHFAIRFTTDNLDNLIKVANFHRNICAHEDILYKFELKKPISTKGLEAILKIPNHLVSRGNVFSMISLLKVVLPKEEHGKLVEEIENLILNLEKSIHIKSYKSIQNDSGFREDWKKYFS